MAAFCARPEAKDISHVFVSDERKAQDGADMLHRALGTPVTVDERLGENDRSATGYVAPPRFWEIVERFFSEPETSVLGWERAVDAQTRIKAAVRDCVATCADTTGDLCFISHGGVGTLLLCDLLGEPISQERSQPMAGGGCFFVFDSATWALEHGWRDIVP